MEGRRRAAISRLPEKKKKGEEASRREGRKKETKEKKGGRGEGVDTHMKNAYILPLMRGKKKEKERLSSSVAGRGNGLRGW